MKEGDGEDFSSEVFKEIGELNSMDRDRVKDGTAKQR